MKKWGMMLVAVLLIFAVVFAGCSKSRQPQPAPSQSPQDEQQSGDLPPLSEKTKVRIAEDGAASGAGFYIATSKGYFAEYNLDIEFVTFANSDEMLPALATGEIDVAGGISTASFFNSIAQGIDVRMIADKGHNRKGASYFTFVIDKDHEGIIRDYSDLRGKRIAVSTENGVDDYIFQQMLNHAGLTRDDVEFVLVSDFSNMLAGMQTNALDAALQIEPLITRGAAEGLHVKFKDATDFAPEAQIAMVLASPKFVTEKRDVALRFVAAYLKALRDYNDVFVKGTGDKEGVIRAMTEYTALKDPALWETVNVPGLNPNGRMFVDDIAAQYEWYKSRGALIREINVEEAIDMSLVEDALRILGEYQ
jgi:NitT/TauT family transport system substrate-binding protein